MGLFDKKNCAICGKEIGMLGTVKLEDGVICKNCSGKLSPYFTGRKRTTVKEIEQQLAYREQNKKNLASFNPDIILGEKTKVYVESGSGDFVVSSYTDWRNHNPDIITRKMLNACDIEVKEHQEELYTKDAEGKRVSYNPPQYEYEYEFIAHLSVNSPYFDEIHFEISDPNARPAGVNTLKFVEVQDLGRKLQATLLPNVYNYNGVNTVTYNTTGTPTTGQTAYGAWTCPYCGKVNADGNFCSGCGKPRPVQTRWFCPNCGKENDGQFCSNCGRQRPL
ncbi:MAG: DUF4428 domain-containing protein [Mogibacterium sp.]|nr:DUF4428 domain-containing protein [Mogibacterium sp.]